MFEVLVEYGNTLLAHVMTLFPSSEPAPPVQIQLAQPVRIETVHPADANMLVRYKDEFASFGAIAAVVGAVAAAVAAISSRRSTEAAERAMDNVRKAGMLQFIGQFNRDYALPKIRDAIRALQLFRDEYKDLDWVDVYMSEYWRYFGESAADRAKAILNVYHGTAEEFRTLHHSFRELWQMYFTIVDAVELELLTVEEARKIFSKRQQEFAKLIILPISERLPNPAPLRHTLAKIVRNAA